MMDDFLQFLREPIAQRSLLACVMIGFANGFVSGLVILKKSALQIGTLSCALLPGIAVAVLLFGLTRWSLLTGAVVAALLVGLGSLFVSRTSRLNQDTALSILHTTAFAAGFIVLVRLGLQQKIDDWLFGSIMSLSDSDLWIAFISSGGEESSEGWAPCWLFTCPSPWAGIWAPPSFWFWASFFAQPICIHHGADV